MREGSGWDAGSASPLDTLDTPSGGVSEAAFVELVVDGTNTEGRVDVDGAGGAADFEPIAVLQNFTGALAGQIDVWPA